MASNRIVLTGPGHHDEGEADSAISPGMAIEMAADGKFDVPQGTLAETLKENSVRIAKEDALQGKTVADAYADGDIVFWFEPYGGAIVQVLVKTGENIAVGDRLNVEAAGSGLFVEVAGTEAKYQFEALESSGGALAANTLIKARRI